jgi:hypothetical protein
MKHGLLKNGRMSAGSDNTQLLRNTIDEKQQESCLPRREGFGIVRGFDGVVVMMGLAVD